MARRKRLDAEFYCTKDPENCTIGNCVENGEICPYLIISKKGLTVKESDEEIIEIEDEEENNLGGFLKRVKDKVW